MPASWDPGAAAADPQLRAHARPMATPTVEAADETAGAMLPQRLVEALATVIGRRLDALDARLDDLTARDGQAAGPDGGEVMAAVERLDATVVELARTVARQPAPAVGGALAGADAVSAAVVERLDALAAGIERPTPAPAGADLTVAVSELAARLAGVEHLLGELVAPAGGATLDDVLARLDRLEPPAGAATADDVLERMSLVEPPAGAATVDDVLERLSVLERPPGAATVDDVVARLDALDAVAPPAGTSAGGLDLAKVLGGRLDAVVARLVHLEATVHQVTMRPAGRGGSEPGGTEPADPAAGRDVSIFERLERQIIELNRILE